MRTRLSWHNLIHDKPRTAVALAGVVFALLLIFLELGFLGSVVTTATVIYDHLDFDVLLTSPEYIDIRKTGTLPRYRLNQAAALPQVTGAEPLYIGLNVWKHPFTRRGRGILVLAARRPHEVFVLREGGTPDYRQLHRADAVLIDRRSRPDFGPQEAGIRTEVGGQRVEIAGQFTLGTGFCADGAILTSDEGFARLFPGHTVDRVSLGLVKLDPGADADAVADKLRRALPADVRVYTRSEIASHETRFWLTTTSVGVIFGFGTIVAVLVGVGIVYQVLSADITKNRAEFATLKAIGYGPRYLAGCVMEEAVLLGILSFLPAVVLAELLYRGTAAAANIPIGMTWGRAALVLALAVAMCVVSGLAALRKIAVADPADLF